MSEEGMPKNYRLLKGIVITLGVLIIAMVIILIVASIMKYNDQKRAEAALVEKYRSSQPAVPAGNMKPFETDITLEAGQEVISVDSNSHGTLLNIGRDGETVKILLIDHSGKVTGTININ